MGRTVAVAGAARLRLGSWRNRLLRARSCRMWRAAMVSPVEGSDYAAVSGFKHGSNVGVEVCTPLRSEAVGDFSEDGAGTRNARSEDMTVGPQGDVRTGQETDDLSSFRWQPAIRHRSARSRN